MAIAMAVCVLTLRWMGLAGVRDSAAARTLFKNGTSTEPPSLALSPPAHFAVNTLRNTLPSSDFGPIPGHSVVLSWREKSIRLQVALLMFYL